MNKLKAIIARWLLGVHVKGELADIRDELREQFNHHERMLNGDLERIQKLEEANDEVACLRSRIAALEVGYAADFQQVRLNLEHIVAMKTWRKVKAKA